MNMFDLIKKNYQLTVWLFLRGLGIVYFFAFYSLSTQVIGLIGNRGILPASDFLVLIAEHFHQYGFWLFPTVFWLNASDTALFMGCIAGCVLSLTLVFGICGGFALILLWALYLSFVNVGQDFLSFQWDILLLEAGFLAIFIAPWQYLEWPWKLNWGPIKYEAKFVQPPIVVIWLIRWLVFRLMFESGLVKLTSGDVNWLHLNALDYHYLTQPLPTVIAWYADKLPHWFNEISVVGVFIIELIIPFFIFAGRKARFIAACAFITLQVLIALTGNYAFFNLLSMVLCICLLDDQLIESMMRINLKDIDNQLKNVRPTPVMQRAVSYIVAGIIFIFSLCGVNRFVPQLSFMPDFLRGLYNLSTNYFLCNGYGLFAVMTTQRLEIQIEGSNDGLFWQEYEFKYKPGSLSQAPSLVAPCQPRLDWQMWFAALSEAQSNPWFVNFIFRLLHGEKEVLALLANNPFPKGAPKYIRARLYDYHFTKARERKITGNWWKRELVGEYFGIVGLE